MNFEWRVKGIFWPLALSAAIVICSTPWGNAHAYTFKRLYSFCGKKSCIDGRAPNAGLLGNASSDIFGATALGGRADLGSLFELSQTGMQKWTLKVLHSFCTKHDCNDGSAPNTALIMDVEGNIFGTASARNQADGGTVFEFTHDGEFKILYSFCPQPGCFDGSGPGGLTYAGAETGAPYDGVSPIFGTTRLGGFGRSGTIFELRPKKRKWAHTVIYNFCSQENCTDGGVPTSVLDDDKGNLVGTTQFGGIKSENYPAGAGTIFELNPSSLLTLYDFCSQPNCADGVFPMAPLVEDATGIFFGTTMGDGGTNFGTVFKFSPGVGMATLYEFCSQTDCSDGREPNSALTFDANGNLFGTTAFGGTKDAGTVFKLNGSLEVLYRFCARTDCADGRWPYAPLTIDPSGNLFGTTVYGGDGKGGLMGGTVFELAP